MTDYYEELNVGGIRSLKDIINLGAYWRDVRMEYSSNNIIYRGGNHFHNESTATENWEVWKYTWSGDDLLRIEGPLPGAWDDRATLSWG
jgi:hypothetical protein